MREGDRVKSEQVTLTLAKGQKRLLQVEAKGRETTPSAVVREMLASYPFVPRGNRKSLKGRPSSKRRPAPARRRSKPAAAGNE